jgi:chitin synthase
MFEKTRHLTGVTADSYELLLMVDADTVLEPDSLRKLVIAMHEDNIIGIYGETRVKNKDDKDPGEFRNFASRRKEQSGN